MVLRRKDRQSGDAGPEGVEQGVEQTPQRAVPWTRSASAWVWVTLLLLFLGLVLLFIVQNLQHTRVTFITAHWSAPLGVDLLLAAVLGGAVVAMVGAVRIVQLRR
ncbi:MAG: hypothetical protein J2O38_00945, partial [Acidimicrobiales bacterium]|nr:hypothetical protein [Acidimicrobiales bacterium]